MLYIKTLFTKIYYSIKILRGNEPFHIIFIKWGIFLVRKLQKYKTEKGRGPANPAFLALYF